MSKYRIILKPDAEDEEIEDFLLERNPRFRKILNASARKQGGLTLEAYRKKRKL